jgi:hypothetical protein
MPATGQQGASMGTQQQWRFELGGCYLERPIQSISASGTLADMTPELAKSAAEVFRQQISKRPKSSSRRSSRPLPAARTG